MLQETQVDVPEMMFPKRRQILPSQRIRCIRVGA